MHKRLGLNNLHQEKRTEPDHSLNANKEGATRSNFEDCSDMFSNLDSCKLLGRQTGAKHMPTDIMPGLMGLNPAAMMQSYVSPLFDVR